MGDWSARSLRADRPCHGAAKTGRHPYERKPVPRHPGHQYRPDHIRGHHQTFHHAVSALLPAARRRRAVSDHQAHRAARRLTPARRFSKFATVIRATVKGTIVIAILQGTLGGVIFWFLGIRAALLWAVLMAFLSLLPAVGAALVWVPVAIYFLVTGAVWEGLVLIAYGALVISLVDNFVRPILVGADTKMPDYVVLISTLGGLEVFGMNGIVLGPVIAAMFIVVWDIFAAANRRKPTSVDKAG